LNTLSAFLPGILIVLAWPFYYALDALLLAIKPGMRTRFPLGYVFVLKK
jgi:hypothetical protein